MTIFNISYKYRLYPNVTQENQISINFNCCRLIYNLMLKDKIEGFKRSREIPLVYPKMYFDRNPSLLAGDLSSFSFEQYHLEKAFRHYLFDQNCNFPKYKISKLGRKSYTTKNQNTSIKICKNKIVLPTLGTVKARTHRMPLQDAKIKSATISQDGDGKYYVSVQFQFEKAIKEFPVNPKTTIGLDYKSDGLYMSSNGKTPKNWKKFFREGEKKIAKEERKLRNKKKGSNNYKKQMMRMKCTQLLDCYVDGSR